jgi:hypothetical protein
VSVSQAHADATREAAEYRELIQAIFDALERPPSSAFANDDDRRMAAMERTAGVRGVLRSVLNHNDPTAGALTIRALMAETSFWERRS